MSPWIYLRGIDPGMYGINGGSSIEDFKRRLQRIFGRVEPDPRALLGRLL